LSHSQINVLELFAGVGGFRVGLERANDTLVKEEKTSNDFFKIVWANQWEPGRSSQDAYDSYVSHYGNTDIENRDIALIDKEKLKKLNPSLVVGGFPCQDYSVARSLSGEKGIHGKKGVLFWEIQKVLEATNPKFILLENVDRLLKSPASQRGRDFGVMLAVLRDLNYDVEWRVINAADYGYPQRRKRVFIFAYLTDSPYKDYISSLEPEKVLFESGFFAKRFTVEKNPYKNRINIDKPIDLRKDIADLSSEDSFEFFSSGYMRDGVVFSAQTVSIPRELKPLSSVLQPASDIDKKYYLSEEQSRKFEYLRGAKKIERTSSTGHSYIFSEGAMAPTDSLEKPGRTMLTSEGSINRSTHIIEVHGKKRFLTPIECERLNGFEDNWTNNMKDRMRYFCMGNALVVDLISELGQEIFKIEKTYPLKTLQSRFTFS